MLNFPVNSYGHVEKVSSPNHTFFLGKLDLVVNQYFMHTISLVTYNNPSWIRGREENVRKNYFMINLKESMRLGRDLTSDPWICSQTHYRLRYMAWYLGLWLNFKHNKKLAHLWNSRLKNKAFHNWCICTNDWHNHDRHVSSRNIFSHMNQYL